MSIIINSLTVLELLLPAQELSFETINDAFARQEIVYHKIENVNWKEFPDKPLVEFAIAYNEEYVFVKYKVEENSIRAFYTEDKECKPFEDSCVEFFVSFDENKEFYYNIESNCIGALQFKSGTIDFVNRTRYGDEVTSLIKRFSTLPLTQIEVQEGEFKWELIMAIPLKVLGIEDGKSLKGKTAYANFYKCGDKLPQAHYISWNPIKTEKPSFHQPKFFGEIVFD